MKKIILFIFLFNAVALTAQEQKYKIFFDTTHNKLYYNRHLPVYFWISTSPNDDGQDVLLQPKVKKYANPYFWDTEGINTVHFKNPKNSKGLKEAVFQLWADSRAPLIFVKFTRFLIKNNKIILGRNSKILIKTLDYFAGTDKVFYKIDTSNFIQYSKPISLTNISEGTHYIKYYSIDKVGNKSLIFTKKFIVKFTPPQVEMKILNSFSDKKLNKNSLITFKANDQLGVQAIYYKIDSEQTYHRFLKPISVKNLTDGQHLIYFYALDKLNNQTQVFVKQIIIDNTKPQISTTFLGPYVEKQKTFYISPNTRIQVNYTDNSPMYKISYRLDNKFFSIKSPVIDVSKFTGYKLLCISAQDIAGNKSNTKCFRIFIDNNPPKSSITVGKPKFFNRDTLFVTSKTPITISAFDTYTGIDQIQYAINNNNFKTYTAPFTLTHDGLNIIYYRARDQVGNIEPTKSKKIYVDNTPPQINIIFSVEPYDLEIKNNDTLQVYPSPLKIYLSAQDDKTGERKILYSLDNSRLKTYKQPIYLKPNNEKIFTLYTESVDALGNKSTKTVKFIIRPK